ncbi:MFS transporter [Nocardia miyunensis]|uniref:MFS transporter n=1 Tax=Nocardia miyunensis TaxID=282684 RepID=UPI0008338F7C|nr:MFS transporter [Nocardia miyunensis]
MTQIAARKQGHTATVIAGCFAVSLAQVAYSLPGALNGTFQQEFGTTGAQLTWVTAAFAIPMVVLELTTGVIGDLFSEGGFARPEIIGAFVAGIVLLGVFVVIELRSEVPLLHLRIFANRSYAVVAIATVVGMFAFLAICYSMSIRLGAVQHQSALKVGVLFLFIQGPAFLLAPLVSELIRNFSPRWILTSGFALIAVSGIWCASFDIHDMSWTRFIAPMLALGVGFALTVGSITAVAINTVPLRLAGMASATTNLLRDFGFALGPVLIAAVAVSRANGDLAHGLGRALGASGLRPPYTGVAGSVAHEGGAMAINSLPVLPGAGPHLPPVPMPESLRTLAFESLGSAYGLAFLIAGLCAAAAALLTLVGLFGSHRAVTEESLPPDAEFLDVR